MMKSLIGLPSSSSKVALYILSIIFLVRYDFPEPEVPIIRHRVSLINFLLERLIEFFMNEWV